MNKNTSKIIAVLGLITSTSLFAGSTTGGGGPPAREKLLQELMAAEPGATGLFDDNGELGLGLKGSLSPELTITRDRTVGLPLISETEFSAIAARKGTITVEAVPADLTIDTTALDAASLRASYRVYDGDTLNSLTLKDRKVLMRAGEKIPLDTTLAPIAQ